MRTPILALVLGFSLAGCLVGDSGTASPGGDDTGSGTGSDPQGSGTGSNPNPNPTATPAVNAAVDRTTVSTELGKSEVITLNLTSVGGFAGNVTVTASLLDGSGAALTAGGLTVTGQPTVALAANGTASAMYTVKIPTNATGTQMAATLKLSVASTAGSKDYTSALTIAPIYNVTYAAGLAGNIQAHPGRLMTFSVKQGAKFALHNADVGVHITHGDGGFPHETTGATGGLPNNTYTLDTSKIAVGSKGNVGCHTHGSATYATVSVE